MSLNANQFLKSDGGGITLSDSYINTQYINYLYIKAYKHLFGNSLYNVNTESSMTEEDHSIHIPQNQSRT